ncbi:MAG: aminomethyl-transferring glycine dehydrogenase subunit GcvPB [Chloroflexi bacterium]|nr:aminomethyl-transferring glycine dehydrogenase subunit GcvPB [Chloroflexota bacterium]MDK1044512.1 aminomethyl-transferring glycine dehydrogenase subunit GcvPB [Anaerolineales bacterium]
MNRLEPTVYELSTPGRPSHRFPDLDVPTADLPEEMLRDHLELPELSEMEVMRHFVRLSQLNFGIDTAFYPLGSCTMKYNPKVNEDAARLPGFAHTHPLQDTQVLQGNLVLMYTLQDWLAEIGGFAGVSLQPAAGAQGELSGILIIRAYHRDQGTTKRTKILVPDSAHGTNPATITMSGLRVVELPSDKRGNVDLEALRAECDDTLAALMLTNPNTLGLFEEHVEEVIGLIHECGGLVYGDGANMNALLGVIRPGDLGFDVLHYNLHKTFSTPHGGGGPGSGPVGVSEALVDYLPGPIVEVVEAGDDEQPPLYGLVMPDKTIGRVKAFHGHFGMHLRAFAYIRSHGKSGMRDIADHAVLNANYLLAGLRDTYHVPFDRTCMHEFVVEGRFEKAPEIHALDISKRLMDWGIHPPTHYFPLIVPEALMIEPTETETKVTLDAFIEAMKSIAQEAVDDPERLQTAPHSTVFGRLDEVQAAKALVLCCRPAELTPSGT